MFRRSKYKHLYSKQNKKEDCYDNVKITKSSWDSTFCSVNPKYIAVITESCGGGSFIILPIAKTGRIERDTAQVAGHKAAVLDIQWCPFNDNLIASASEDCTVKIWQIPEDGLPEGANMTEPAANLVYHQRRVGFVQWHPTAEHVLASSGADNLVIIWDVSRELVLKEIVFPDMVLCISFNRNGSQFACTCKDKKTRVVDCRTGEIKAEGHCHEGNKPQQVVYLNNSKLFTTGFSRMSERQYAMWDDSNLREPLEQQDIDSSNGVMFPFYDYDTGLIYLCGKGDSSIRYFEITDEAPYIFYLNQYQSADPQRGMGMMPKRGIDVTLNEMCKLYKLHSKGFIETISFIVPRKCELFQEDLYPDTVMDEPALSAEDWLSGINKDPILMGLKDHYGSHDKDKGSSAEKKSFAKRGIKCQINGVNNGQDTTSPSKNKSPSENNNTVMVENVSTAQINMKEYHQLLNDMTKMKIIIKGHEKRIKTLEGALSAGGVSPSHHDL